MLYQDQQGANPSHRMKQIQKSNSHVNNIIESAKKMIYNDKQLSSNEKEVLQIKISIEKDHLKNAFYKIDCPSEDFKLEISRRSPSRQHQSQYEQEQKRKIPIRYPQRTDHSSARNSSKQIKQKSQFSSDAKNNIYKIQDLAPTDQNQLTNKQPDTKITISRYIQPNQSNQCSKRSVQVYQNKEKEQFQINVSNGNGNQTVNIKPLRNSQVVVTTRTQSIDKDQRQVSNSYFASRQKHYQDEEYTPTFSSYRKNRQHVLTDQHEDPTYNDQRQRYSQQFQQQITITTPRKHVQLISTETQERLFIEKPYQQISNKKRSPKTQSFNFNNTLSTPLTHQYELDQKHKDSQPSTSYKEILQKNKSRLNSSRQQIIHLQPSKSPSPKYELHLDQLYKKKQQEKKRLYGNSQHNSSRILQNSFSSTTQKYSIANSRKTGPIIANLSRKINDTSRNSRSGSVNISQSSLSKDKQKPLHSTTIKSYHAPCSTCSRCKSAYSSPKQPKQSVSSFHLAKKYLTPEGQQECYNFLKSQGIPQKDWAIFITEYVYRQLSKAYQQVTPREQAQ